MEVGAPLVERCSEFLTVRYNLIDVWRRPTLRIRRFISNDVSILLPGFLSNNLLPQLLLDLMLVQ